MPQSEVAGTLDRPDTISRAARMARVAPAEVPTVKIFVESAPNEDAFAYDCSPEEMSVREMCFLDPLERTYPFQDRQRVLQLSRMFVLGCQAIVNTDKNSIGFLRKLSTQQVLHL